MFPHQGHKVLRRLSADAAPLCPPPAQWDVLATKTRCPQAAATGGVGAAAREAARLTVFVGTPPLLAAGPERAAGRSDLKGCVQQVAL